MERALGLWAQQPTQLPRMVSKVSLQRRPSLRSLSHNFLVYGEIASVLNLISFKIIFFYNEFTFICIIKAVSCIFLYGIYKLLHACV